MGASLYCRVINEPAVITVLSEEYFEDQFASECVAKGFTKAKSFFRDTEGNAALVNTRR